MTKMLLPTVPSMAPKIHSNDQYPLFGRLKPYRKQCIIFSKLEALRRDKQFIQEVVRDYHKLLQTNLLSYAEPTRDRVIRRLNGHPSLSNEGSYSFIFFIGCPSPRVSMRELVVGTNRFSKLSLGSLAASLALNQPPVRSCNVGIESEIYRDPRSRLRSYAE